MEKLIITACICGAEVTKEQNPAVPYTVEEIAREAKAAYDAGAALIHLHVRATGHRPRARSALMSVSGPSRRFVRTQSFRSPPAEPWA